MRYVVVLNHGRGNGFARVEASSELARARELGARVVNLPRLHEAAMAEIDAADSSFWAAINRADASGGALGMFERHRVRVWLKAAYAEFEPILTPA